MKRLVFFLAVMVVTSLSCIAQQSAAEQDAYTKTINARADKIVATLNIADAKKAAKVRDIIAKQYRNLNEIYTSRDNKIATAKQQFSNDKAAMSLAVKKLQEETVSPIEKLHHKYIKQLSSVLTKEQVDKVKDGMTYNVLHVTYTGYNNMITNLSEEQKQQIMTWLIEAREQAMDAESSDKKHAWFGKYKGRINNYLSAAGYDLKKEGQEWEKRRNAAKAVTGSAANQ